MSEYPDIEMFEYPGGVLAIDSGFMREVMATCYLVEDEDEVAFIETGSNASVPRLLRALEVRGWRREQVRYVIVTHVHLDHAGGAGALMAELPHATFLVHPRGARHMIDPTKLEASVRQVYGDDHYDETYGQLVPIPKERVRVMEDGDTAQLGQRTLTFRDAPGHARHHFCIWDEQTRGWFTGDTFGLSYRELDSDKGPFIFPTTTPIQFDPDAARSSIDLLMSTDPQAMFLTHFGRVQEVSRLANDLRAGIDELVALAVSLEDAPDRSSALQDGIWAWIESRARAHGVTMAEHELKAVVWPDVVLNTQGIEFWLDHDHA